MPHPLIAYPMSRDTFVCMDGGNNRDERKFIFTITPLLLHVLRARPSKFYFRMEWTSGGVNDKVNILKGGSGAINLKEWTKEYIGKEAGAFLIELFMDYLEKNDFTVQVPKLFVYYNGDKWIEITGADWKNKTVTVKHRNGRSTILRIPEDMNEQVKNTSISWSYLIEAIATATILLNREERERIISMANEKTDKLFFYDIRVTPAQHMEPSTKMFFFDEKTNIWLHFCDENTSIPLDNKYDMIYYLVYESGGRKIHKSGSMHYNISSKKCFVQLWHNHTGGELLALEFDLDAKADKDGVRLEIDGVNAYISFFDFSPMSRIMGLLTSSNRQVWGITLYPMSRMMKGIHGESMHRSKVLELVRKMIR